MKFLRALLLSGLVLLTGCSPPEIPPGHALVEGNVTTTNDIIAFFQVSEADFEKCSKAYETAKLHPRRVAPGFMRDYYDLDAIGYTAGLPIENFKFRKIVPQGAYIMAFPDGDHGSFLPVRVSGSINVNYDKDAVWMTTNPD